METNYRIAYDKGWQDLKKMVPEEIPTRLAVTYCSSTRQFTVTFFNSEYILDCNTETIYRKSDRHIPGIMESIIILNYLSFSQLPVKKACKWVSLKEISTGGMLFYPAFHKNAIMSIIHAFGHQSKQLLACAATLGGKPASFGNASAIFQAFPEIPLCVIIWEGDAEVPSNATILYDPSIEYLMHIESLIGLGMYLADQLKRLAVSSLPLPS